MAIYKLGEICKLVSGDPKRNMEWTKNNKGKYPFVSSQTTNEGIAAYINSYDFDGEYITITGGGAYAGTVFYRNYKFSIMNKVWLLKDLKNEIKAKYLYFYLKRNSKVIFNIGKASAVQPNIYAKDLKNLEIEIPPLKEQQKIIDIIEPLEKILSLKKENLTLVKKLKECLIIRINKNLSQIQDFYFKEILDFKTGIDIKEEIISDNPNSLSWIKLGNTKENGSINYFDSIKVIDSLPKKKANKNDILLCWSCDAGRVFYLEKDCYFSTAFYNLIIKDEYKNRINKKFLYFFLQGKKKEINSIAVGSVLKKANMKILSSVKVKIPDLKIQQEIISIIELR